MNTIEHNHVEREEINGICFGMVIKNDDSENIGRVKVRVRGVFNEPVKKEDIPWAIPLTGCDVPSLGDEVCVLFENGDIERPRYFPKTLLDKAQIDLFDKIYSSIVSRKKGSVKTGVLVVDGSFSEPGTQSDGLRSRTKKLSLFPEDVAKEQGEGVDVGNTDNGTLVEVNKEKGKESISVYHPKGTFLEVMPNGDVVVHGVRDLFSITEGDSNYLVGGNLLMKVEGSLEIKVGGGIKVVSDSPVLLESPDVTITGGTLKVDGSVAPTGTGPFCALPACLFTGASHVGNTVSGT